MSKTFVRLVSRMLIVCMLGLPFQAQAGMIGTGDAVGAAEGNAARDTLRAIVERAEAAGRLQDFGLAPQAARERLAALTDAEAAMLARHVEQLPAGANGAGIGMLVVIVFLIYHFIVGPALSPAEAKKEPAKPAPQKK